MVIFIQDVKARQAGVTFESPSLPPDVVDRWSSRLWEESLGQDSHEAASRETVQTVGRRGAAHVYDGLSNLLSPLASFKLYK